MRWSAASRSPYKGRTIVASADQPMASINGRVVTLPAPVARVGQAAVGADRFHPACPGSDLRLPIELRRASRLLIVGTIRVARVVVRIDAAGPPTRANLEVTPALLVSAAFDAGRVLVRIEADVIDAPPPPAAAGLIEQIRTGDQTTTVAITLNARAGTPRVSTMTSTESTRVSIEIPLAAQSQDTNASPVAPPATPPPSVPVPGEPPPPLLGGRTAKLQTMVIDAGHGGDDAGVHGPKGTLEKQITLDVARRLKTLVETRLGVRVVMTRDADRSVSADERDAIANNSKADLFLSVHVNGSPSAGLKGAEVYYLRLDRAGEEARRSAAATELCCPRSGAPRDPSTSFHGISRRRRTSMLRLASPRCSKRNSKSTRPWDRARCSNRRYACSAERTCPLRSSRLPISPTPNRNVA